MSKLVPALRRLLGDLVEKRLWPLALALVIALVAIPFVLGGSASEPPAPDPAGSTAPDPAAAASASAVPGATAKPTTASARKESGGPIDDPFFDPPRKRAESQTVAAAGGSTRAVAEKTSDTASAKKPATAAKPRPAKSPSKSATTPAKSATPPAVAGYLRTVVRLNAADGHPANAIARLTPLGGAADPAALFLGVTKADSRARYAVFVLGPNATSHGEAICKGATGCRMFGLKAGDVQTVTLRGRDGRRLQFTLRVESIRAIFTDAAHAATRRAHVHPDGRRALRVMRADAATAAALRTAEYDTQAGLLVSSDDGTARDASK